MATKNTSSDKALKQFYQKNKIIINGVLILGGAFVLQKQLRKWIAAGRAWKMSPNFNTQTTIDVNGQNVPIDINLHRKASEFWEACWNYGYGWFGEDEDTMLKVIKSVPCNLMGQLAYIYSSQYGENLVTDAKDYMSNSYYQEVVTHCPQFFS